MAWLGSVTMHTPASSCHRPGKRRIRNPCSTGTEGRTVEHALESRGDVNSGNTGRLHLQFGTGTQPERGYYATFLVEDMATARDAWAVRLHLLRVAGVQWVQAVRARGHVRVAYDPARVSPQALLTALAAGRAAGRVRLLVVARPAHDDFDRQT